MEVDIARLSGQIGASGDYWTVIGASRGGVCLGRGARVRRIYKCMTREEFIQILDEKRYSYEIDGDKVVVKHSGNVSLESIESIPPGVVFNNRNKVLLRSIKVLPSDTVFMNGGDVELWSLEEIQPRVKFINKGSIDFGKLESLSAGTVLQNKGMIFLSKINIIDRGVVFQNEKGVMIGRTDFSEFSWSGNIEGINSKRLLNFMISKGLFER